MINNIVGLRLQLDQKSEETDEVEEATDSHQRHVSVVADHIDKVSCEQLGHNLNNHGGSHVFARIFLGEEADRFFEEMNNTLERVNLAHDIVELLRLIVEALRLLLIGLRLTEVEREPVGELDTVNRFTHILLLESTKAK